MLVHTRSHPRLFYMTSPLFALHLVKSFRMGNEDRLDVSVAVNHDAVNPETIIPVIGESVAWPQRATERGNMGIEGQSVVADKGT